jgi:signal transduction histidine kinase
MLGFSRSSDEPPAPCDPNAVVDDTLKLLGDRFLREVEVRFDRAAALPQVSAAKDLIQQILLNFILNATDAMERRAPNQSESGATKDERADSGIGAPEAQPRGRKQVVLATRPMDQLPADIVLPPARASSYVAISVRDCGGGIAPENLPRIFEPFFTTKALSTRRGTGLGLSMVYELAKKIKAGLAVESVVGLGSTFTLILPVSDLTAAENPATSVRHPS